MQEEMKHGSHVCNLSQLLISWFLSSVTKNFFLEPWSTSFPYDHPPFWLTSGSHYSILASQDPNLLITQDVHFHAILVMCCLATPVLLRFYAKSSYSLIHSPDYIFNFF